MGLLARFHPSRATGTRDSPPAGVPGGRRGGPSQSGGPTSNVAAGRDHAEPVRDERRVGVRRALAAVAAGGVLAAINLAGGCEHTVALGVHAEARWLAMALRPGVMEEVRLRLALSRSSSTWSAVGRVPAGRRR